MIRSIATGRSGVMLGSFLLALILRVAYLLSFQGHPFYSQLLVDAQWHDEWAWDWAQGIWGQDGRAFFRAPLYPLWLSAIYRVFGHDLVLVRIIQAVMGAATAAALAGSGYRLRGRGTAWITGALAALYGPLVFFDAELLIPNLLLALLSWSLFMLTGKVSLARMALAGLLLGLAGIARPNTLVLILPVAFLVFRRGTLRHAIAVLALAIAPAVVVTAINAVVEKTLVVVASQGGVNFYAGNHARASGRTVEIPELENIISWRQFVIDARKVAEKETGRSLNSRQISNWWTARGLNWAWNHPVDALSLTTRKAYYLLNAYEVPNNRDLYFDRPGVLNPLLWKMRWFGFPWGLVFPLAAVGWLTARRNGELRHWVDFLGLWILLYGLSILPFFVTARFRLGLVPAVLLLAAMAIPFHRPRIRVDGVAVFLVTLILVNSNLFGVRTENPAHYLALRGDALMRAGQVEEALDSLEKAHAQDPGNTALANLLASAYSFAGRYGEARVLYEKVVADRPDDPDVRFNLGVANLALERFDDASNNFRMVV